MADRHLSELMAQAPPPPSSRSEAPPAGRAEAGERSTGGGGSDKQAPVGQDRQHADDQLADALASISSKVDAVAAEVALLTRAVAQALDATNDRLASLERLLLADPPAAGAPAEQAVARLRLRLRQTAQGIEKRQGGSEAGRRPT